MSRRFWLWHAGLPVLLVLLITAGFRLTSWDLDISRSFYAAESREWLEGSQAPWQQLYDWGKGPGWVIFGTALAVIGAGWFWQRARSWRVPAVFLVAVMVIGPGLLVNAVFKDHWGRPRPRQVVELGGQYPFEPVLTYDPQTPGKSFPSGHAAVAFYLMALYFVGVSCGWPGWVRVALLVGGFAFGLAMGLARIMQGGHFASDILWAAAVIWLVACACAAWILRLPRVAPAIL